MGRKKDEFPKKPLTFRIDSDLKTKLDELAKAKGRKVSNLINLSVSQFLDKNESELPELPEIFLDRERIAEITLMLQGQYFHKIGHEKYINELKVFAKEFNISDDDIFKVFAAVFKLVWNMDGSC